MKKSNLSKFALLKMTVSRMNFINGGASDTYRTARNAGRAGRTPNDSCNNMDDDCDG
ncbi:hypothetical protein [uncultured Kordia sp.]|uniref:hypothetical protein n=1 Tax=uncultured Kordia sp. TaxID=507699 RepID=UPI002637D019|nr:hypothetical protein [uncultured Kordia sp.]